MDAIGYSNIKKATDEWPQMPCVLCDHFFLNRDEFRWIPRKDDPDKVAPAHESCLWKLNKPIKAKPVPRVEGFVLSQGTRSDKTCPECHEELPLSGECGNCA